MFHVVLVEPQIPPNTGNIIRLCANTGCSLHLVGSLGFELSEKALRRAGLDYRDLAEVRTWPSWAQFLAGTDIRRWVTLSTRHRTSYSQFQFEPGDALVFGSETRGLPDEIRDDPAQAGRLHLPMMAANRSLNLSNSVAIVVYEAWRQQQFSGSISR